MALPGQFDPNVIPGLYGTPTLPPAPAGGIVAQAPSVMPAAAIPQSPIAPAAPPPSAAPGAPQQPPRLGTFGTIWNTLGNRFLGPETMGVIPGTDQYRQAQYKREVARQGLTPGSAQTTDSGSKASTASTLLKAFLGG